jgi:hypothetical protein
MTRILSSRFALFSTLMIGFSAISAPAAASTIWTDWSGATAGAPGTATGSVGGVGVTYSGELDNFVLNGISPIWFPDSSFIGGTVDTSPSVVGDDLRLDGVPSSVNTITFASSVTDPVFAIWSLGRSTSASTFTFDATPTFQAGGPNSLFGGAPITVAGNVVSGFEGNGVVQFTGSFDSISWTNTPEFFYAFTVGLNGEAPPPPIPEPATLILVGTGSVGLLTRRWRRALS